ncbi:MAG: winged helix-turn-helix domain-containing protein, partial [Cyanobacteriota bacterium]
MPAPNYLTPTQKENLQKALRESDCPHLRERILMLLLMNDGKTYQEITDFLGCASGIELSSSQVRRILKEKKYVYLWAKYSLEDKQNPQKREAFKE